MKKAYILVFAFLLCACSKKEQEKPLAPGELPDPYSNRSTGSAANDILSNTTYESVVLEVLYTPGYKPEPDAIANLENFIKSHTYKTAIQTSYKEIPTQADTLAIEDIRDLEQKQRTVYTSSKTLGLCMIFTNSYYSSPDVLGVAYRSTSLCLFGSIIFARSGKAGQRTRVAMESTVMDHEAGHLMGLVNINSNMQTPHEDTANDHHCINKTCLMYYATESGGIIHNSQAGYIPSLDTSCIKDLVANGGR